MLIEDIPSQVMEEMKEAWGTLDFSSYGDRVPPSCRSFKLEYTNTERENVEANLPCLETGGFRKTRANVMNGYYVRAVISEDSAQIYHVDSMGLYYRELEGEGE